MTVSVVGSPALLYLFACLCAFGLVFAYVEYRLICFAVRVDVAFSKVIELVDLVTLTDEPSVLNHVLGRTDMDLHLSALDTTTVIQGILSQRYDPSATYLLVLSYHTLSICDQQLKPIAHLKLSDFIASHAAKMRAAERKESNDQGTFYSPEAGVYGKIALPKGSGLDPGSREEPVVLDGNGLNQRLITSSEPQLYPDIADLVRKALAAEQENYRQKKKTKRVSLGDSEPINDNKLESVIVRRRKK